MQFVVNRVINDKRLPKGMVYKMVVNTALLCGSEMVTAELKIAKICIGAQNDKQD